MRIITQHLISVAPTTKTDKGKTNLRLFVAYPFPKSLWKYAEALQTQNRIIENVRWTIFQNLHLTIFFLGEIYASDLDKVMDKIRNDVFTSSPFSLIFEKIELKKARKHSGMMWMKFLQHQKFSSLSNRLNNSLKDYLIHTYVVHDAIPHVTLARWRGHFEPEKINIEYDSSLQLPEINYCELWQSVNTADGVRYKSLERFEMIKC